MSSTVVTLPSNALQTLNGIGMNIGSRPTKLKNPIKGDKKVEVRWLDSEADLYIKQWQRRYRQLEGINDNRHHFTWSRSRLLEQYDDWCLTARRILDIDVSYMNSKDYNKFNLENFDHGFDFFLNRRNSKLMFNIENEFEDDDFELDEEFLPFESFSLDPNIEVNEELFAALRSNNLVFKNGKIEYIYKKGKNLDKDKTNTSEKQIKKTNKGSPDSAINTSNESNTLSNVSPNNKCSTKTPRIKTNNKPRNRPTTTRRQMYVCEYPGCSYQSDRNFNFLRHKRTHGKQKNDENKKQHNTISNNLEVAFSPRKISNIIGDTPFEATIELNPNDMIPLGSHSPLISNELNLNLAQCNTSSISESEQTFSLNNDDFIERQNIIMKDINNLDHVLADNHFSSISLDQSFMP